MDGHAHMGMGLFSTKDELLSPCYHIEPERKKKCTAITTKD